MWAADDKRAIATKSGEARLRTSWWLQEEWVSQTLPCQGILTPPALFFFSFTTKASYLCSHHAFVDALWQSLTILFTPLHCCKFSL